MYVARSHADFNESLNKIAGTDNIQYATPWEMSTRTGRAFMLKNNMQVGRLFASNALTGNVGNSKLLATTQLSPMQKATLSALALSNTEQQYNAALLSAIRHGALKNTAARVLAKPSAHDYVPPPQQPNVSVAAATSAVPDDVHMADPDAAPAPDVQLAEAADAPSTQLSSDGAALLQSRPMNGGNSLVPARKRKSRKT